MGVQIDLAKLGIAFSAAPALGRILPGRDLANLDAPKGERSPGMWVMGEQPKGTNGYLIAVLNPDGLAVQYGLLAGDLGKQSALLSYGGTVLVTGEHSTAVPGMDAAHLPPFKEYLPGKLSSEYVGAALEPGKQLVAFRTLRNWPLVLLVQNSHSAVWAAWLGTFVPVLGIASALLVGLFFIAALVMRDAKRQAVAHAKVEASEARQQVILESVLDAIVTIDTHGIIRHFNAAAERMFGYSRQEAEGRQMQEMIVPPDLRDRHASGMARLRVGGDDILSKRVEADAMRRDGTVFPMEIAIVPIQTGEGIWFTSTIRDITRRKADERAMRESERLQQAILESALDAIVTIDTVGDIRHFNAAAETMFGYSRQEAVGRPLKELIVPLNMRSSHAAGIARVRAGGEHRILRKRVEVEAMRHGGDLFPIELAIVPIQTAEGLWFTSTIRDITRRKADERAIRESETRFRATFEQAAVGMLHQARDRRLLRVNSTMREMLGYTEAEFLALDPQSFIHPDDVQNGLEGMQALFAGKLAVFRQDKRYLHKRGHYVWVRLTAAIVHAESEADYMSCVLEDITEHKRTLDELDAAQKRELEIGLRIQQSLLVDGTPTNIPDLDFATFSQPSRGIDGDFYDVMDLGNGVVDILVGDVMGKGVPAALLGAATKMQFARSMTRLVAHGVPSPAEVLEHMDRAVGPHLQALNAFVTLVYLRIDCAKNSVTWIGCGHEEPMLARADGTFEVLANQLPPFGVLTAPRYEQETKTFGPCDHLFMCSDGVSDAMLSDGSRIGAERVRALVTQALAEHQTPAMSLHSVRRAIQNTEATITDDLTMLLVGRRTQAVGGRRVELEAALTSVKAARSFVQQECDAMCLPPEKAGPFTVAVIEAVTNVIRHGQGLTAGAPLELSSTRSEQDLVVQLRYLGNCFAPPAVVPERDLAQLPEQGFGLLIMQRASDRMEHDYHGGANILRLVVSLAPAASAGLPEATPQ